MGVSLGHVPDHERCSDSLVLHRQLCGGCLLPVWYVVYLRTPTQLNCHFLKVHISTIKYCRSLGPWQESHGVNVHYMSKIGSM